MEETERTADKARELAKLHEGAKYIIQGDDITAVLRGHARIDEMLTTLISTEAPYAFCFIPEKNLTFSRKCDILFKMNVLTSQWLDALTGINSIRNRFAHHTDDIQLTKDDDARMSQLMRTLAKEHGAVGDAISEDNAIVGSAARNAILEVYINLADMAEHMKDAADWIQRNLMQRDL